KKLICSLCQMHSDDFQSHHEHMKKVHKLHSFTCRKCIFTTRDPQRLSTHFRAKHVISSRSQNMQCSFCNGICLGIDRMSKHLITKHSVQTGPDEYTCTNCLQPHGGGDQLLQHSLSCSMRNKHD